MTTLDDSPTVKKQFPQKWWHYDCLQESLSDYNRLAPDSKDEEGWLNDGIVNAYCNILQVAETEGTVATAGLFSKDHRVYFATSYVLDKLFFKRAQVTHDPRPSAKLIDDQYKPKFLAPFNLQDILDARFIVLPVCDYSHWTLAVVDVQKSVVHYFDSRIKRDRISSELYNTIVGWVKRLQSERNLPCDQEWDLFIHRSIPQQTNWWDCGVYVLAFLNHLVFKGWTLGPESFCQKDFPNFRLQLTRQLRAREVAPLTVRGQHFSSNNLVALD